MIFGIILLMRVIGKIMVARRAVQDQEGMKQAEAEKQKAKSSYGKTKIIGKQQIPDNDFTDYEEVND